MSYIALGRPFTGSGFSCSAADNSAQRVSQMRGNTSVAVCAVHSSAQVELASAVREMCVIYECHSMPNTCILCWLSVRPRLRCSCEVFFCQFPCFRQMHTYAKHSLYYFILPLLPISALLIQNQPQDKAAPIPLWISLAQAHSFHAHQRS